MASRMGRSTTSGQADAGHLARHARSARRAVPPAGTSRWASIPAGTSARYRRDRPHGDGHGRRERRRQFAPGRRGPPRSTRRCSISVRDRSGTALLAGAAQADLDQGHGQGGEVEDDPTPGGDDGGAGEEGRVGQAVHVLLPALLLELADLHLDRGPQHAGERSGDAVGQDLEDRLEQTQARPFAARRGAESRTGGPVVRNRSASPVSPRGLGPIRGQRSARRPGSEQHHRRRRRTA